MTYYHFTTKEAFGKIQQSRRLVAATEGRVFLSKEPRPDPSLPKTFDHVIELRGFDDVQPHPCWCPPSLWGAMKRYLKRQYVGAIGKDIVWESAHQSEINTRSLIVCDARYADVPRIRGFLGLLRLLGRYVLIDGFLVVGVVAAICIYLGYFAEAALGVLICWGAGTFCIGAIWYCIQGRINRLVMSR